MRQVLALMVLPLLWGCGPRITVPPLALGEFSRTEEAGNYPLPDYRIEPGDTIQIRYTFHPDMTQEVIVRPDGKISAHMVGEIIAAGMTTTQVEQILIERTSDRLRSPEVVVGISRFGEKTQTVYVGGEVGKPGAVSYRRGLTPLQAIVTAGGFLTTARTDSIILVRAGEGMDKDLLGRKLGLADMIADAGKEPLRLAPYDVLFVPRSPIAEANLWVRQHITELIPFLGKVGAGYRGGF